MSLFPFGFRGEEHEDQSREVVSLRTHSAEESADLHLFFPLCGEMLLGFIRMLTTARKGIVNRKGVLGNPGLSRKHSSKNSFTQRVCALGSEWS